MEWDSDTNDEDITWHEDGCVGDTEWGEEESIHGEPYSTKLDITDGTMEPYDESPSHDTWAHGRPTDYARAHSSSRNPIEEELSLCYTVASDTNTDQYDQTTPSMREIWPEIYNPDASSAYSPSSIPTEPPRYFSPNR